MDTKLDKGYLVVGNVVALAVGNAAAVPIFQVSNNANQIGTKSGIIRKIKISDTGAGTRIHIGTGAAGAVVDRIPAIATIAGLDTELEENEIPEYEFFTDAMAYVDALGAGAVTIQLTVEERG